MLKIFNFWPFLWLVGQMRRRAGHEGGWSLGQLGCVDVFVGCEDGLVVKVCWLVAKTGWSCRQVDWLPRQASRTRRWIGGREDGLFVLTGWFQRR